MNNLFNNKITLLINACCIINNIGIDDENIEELSIDNFDESNEYNSVKIFLNEIGKYPLLSDVEEKELCSKILNGDENARKILINSNLRLVVSIAKKYIGIGLLTKRLNDLFMIADTTHFSDVLTVLYEHDRNIIEMLLKFKNSSNFVQIVSDSLSISIDEIFDVIKKVITMYDETHTYQKKSR